MQKRIGKRNTLDDRFPGGLFASASGDYMWVAALPPGGLFVEHAGESLYDAANELIAENPPDAYHPQMRAEVAGPVATAIASRQAIENDIKCGDRDLPAAGGAVDRPLLPQAARDLPDRRPGGHGRGRWRSRSPSWRSAT